MEFRSAGVSNMEENQLTFSGEIESFESMTGLLPMPQALSDDEDDDDDIDDDDDWDEDDDE